MQVVRLTGVVDDGTNLGPEVPRVTATAIQIPRNAPVTLEIEVLKRSGVHVDLQSASAFTAWLSVVRQPVVCSPKHPDYQLEITKSTSGSIKAGTRHVLVFSVPALAFYRFSPGRYFFDVVLNLDGNRYQIVQISALHLEISLRRV